MLARKPDDGSLPAPTVDGTFFTFRGEEFAVLVVSQPAPSYLDDLSGAEREICAYILAGRSNADIAKLRGTSINTVENQIASLFRKLGIYSRSELAALF